jgi:hypothetical protein
MNKCNHCDTLHDKKGMYCSKKCTDAAYRARKKAAAVVPVTSSTTDPDEVIEKFTKRFGFPVRLFWNKRLERENSSCAKAGTNLEFEQISKKGGKVIYRVRRGKRNFFTSDKELADS